MSPAVKRVGTTLLPTFSHTIVCSHFATVTSPNRAKSDETRRTRKQCGTARCSILLPKDQRVTGHGRVVLITQRSLVQIQPPQPKKNKGLAGAISLAPSSFSVFFPVGRLAQRSSSALSCSFRVRGDCSPRPALAMIIALGSSPDQSRQINHLLTGRSFGEGQVAPTPLGGTGKPTVRHYRSAARGGPCDRREDL